MATHWTARWTRSTAKFCAMVTKPLFSSPRRLAAGTRQPSKWAPAVSDAHQPILRRALPTVKPGVPRLDDAAVLGAPKPRRQDEVGAD